MRHYKTEAVILDASDVFDADRFLLLFTRELGKVRARARGVRKPTSRLTGHLLSYVPTQLELVGSASGGLTVTQAQIQAQVNEATYPENPLLFQRQAGIIAEAVNRLYVDMEAHPDVYDGLVYTLDRLLAICGAGEAALAELVAAEFLLKGLAVLGYRPELGADVGTGEALDPENLFWSSDLGGVTSQSAGGRRLSSPKVVVALRQFLLPEFYAERLAMPDAVREETVQVIYDYLQYQIGKPLRSLGK